MYRCRGKFVAPGNFFPPPYCHNVTNANPNSNPNLNPILNLNPNPYSCRAACGNNFPMRRIFRYTGSTLSWQRRSGQLAILDKAPPLLSRCPLVILPMYCRLIYICLVSAVAVRSQDIGLRPLIPCCLPAAFVSLMYARQTDSSISAGCSAV